jgi:hypothetical protein
MMISRTEGGLPQAVKVRPMIETDHVDAARIFRMVFGTFLGLPNPMAFAGDADFIRTRWRATPEAALTAEIDGQVVGSNFATRWGSVGFLALYQLYGFQPRFLTSVLSAPAGSSRSSVGWSNFSTDADRDRRLADCASLTDSIYPGLEPASSSSQQPKPGRWTR